MKNGNLHANTSETIIRFKFYTLETPRLTYFECTKQGFDTNVFVPRSESKFAEKKKTILFYGMVIATKTVQRRARIRKEQEGPVVDQQIDEEQDELVVVEQ